MSQGIRITDARIIIWHFFYLKAYAIALFGQLYNSECLSARRESLAENPRDLKGHKANGGKCRQERGMGMEEKINDGEEKRD